MLYVYLLFFIGFILGLFITYAILRSYIRFKFDKMCDELLILRVYLPFGNDDQKNKFKKSFIDMENFYKDNFRFLDQTHKYRFQSNLRVYNYFFEAK